MDVVAAALYLIGVLCIIIAIAILGSIAGALLAAGIIFLLTAIAMAD
jgi:hypothetical protein